MILSFHKQPGAFVDREFPKGITKDLGIDATDQNKIYSLHRMRNTRPNYLFLKAKNITIASYFSGFDLRQYVGRPNQCVSVILDNNENPTRWEGELRRLTFELLPILADIRKDEIPISGLSPDSKFNSFDRILGDYLQKLKDGLIEPMGDNEGEVLVGDGAKVDTISDSQAQKSLIGTRSKELSLTADDILKATEFAKSHDNSTPSVDPMLQASQQMEIMEKESLRQEVRKLHQLVNDRDNRILALESQLRDAKQNNFENVAKIEVAQIRGEYEALLMIKQEEVETWQSKVAELNENNFINQDNIIKLNEMMMMQSEEMQNQSRLISELKAKIKEIEGRESHTNDNQNLLNQSNQEKLNQTENQIKIHLEELDSLRIQYNSAQMNNNQLQEEKNRLEEQLLQANSISNDYLMTKKKLDIANQIIHELENENKNLSMQSANNSSKSELSDVNQSSDKTGFKIDFAAEVNRLKLENKKLNFEMTPLKNELMETKKNLKIQEREIEHLKKLAGFH